MMTTSPPPNQSTPPTSSDERMHLMNETCWCCPNVLAVGQGSEFRVKKVDHRGQITPGDRVAVDDPALAELRRIMREATGEEPEPNNEGQVERVLEDGSFLIFFDDGGSAPYPPEMTRRII